MNRPAKYHISDPVLPWVYSDKDAEEYFDYLEKKLKRWEEGYWEKLSSCVGPIRRGEEKECSKFLQPTTNN